MNNAIKTTLSWVISLWIAYIFIGSLAYKFTDAAEPIHIFTTIGDWMSGFLGTTVGGLFQNYGAILIGGFELLVALVLFAPLIFWGRRQKLHCLGGLMASFVMMGAIFFHLATPLGWVVRWMENGELQTDAGLANAAVSIFISGIVLAFLNKKTN